MTSEDKLLQRARAYDEDALGELYDRYAPRIYAYIYRRVEDASTAEDLTGEVFLRMLQAIRGERFWHTSFRGWLYRIAHNLVVDHYRHRPPAPMIPLDERLTASDENPAQQVARRFSRRRLRAAIRRLTEGQQEVLALRFGQHLTSREVAEIMDKSISAVEALQHRALVALRRMLERENDG
ncbi:MAG: sigma-70 family RNA polymerase sigma factor [Anaerolineae bacterium]